MENFKKDLNNTIRIVDEKLNDKVDIMGVENLCRSFEDKVMKALIKKLDNNDLRKNNNLIDRKFSMLENKISRVLTETLIDLQSEEAPLILKQSAVKEDRICISCNGRNGTAQNGSCNSEEDKLMPGAKSTAHSYVGHQNQNYTNNLKLHNAKKQQNAEPSTFLNSSLPTLPIEGKIALSTKSKLKLSKPNFKANFTTRNKDSSSTGPIGSTTDRETLDIRLNEVIQEEIEKFHTNGKKIIKLTDQLINNTLGKEYK